jgi:hypothetical protein
MVQLEFQEYLEIVLLQELQVQLVQMVAQVLRVQVELQL